MRTIELLMEELVQRLADATDERRYNVVKVSRNINGSIGWELYTPSAGWVSGGSFEEAIGKIGSRAEVAEMMRQKAAELQEKADELMKGDQ